MEPTGPAGACHRAGQRPDPVGRTDGKLCGIRHGLTRISLTLNPGYQAATSVAPLTRNRKWGKFPGGGSQGLENVIQARDDNRHP